MQDTLKRLSWTIFEGEGSLWHGTQPEAVESIARQGLLRGGRTHVHLAESRDSSVGKRASVGVLLEISPARLRAAGQTMFQSPNGVILCRHVPPACIVGVHPLTKRARDRGRAAGRFRSARLRARWRRSRRRGPRCHRRTARRARLPRCHTRARTGSRHYSRRPTLRCHRRIPRHEPRR